MPTDLMEIITTGGPVGFALLFAWLWFRAEKKLDSANERADGVEKELRDKLTADIQWWQAQAAARGGPMQ